MLPNIPILAICKTPSCNTVWFMPTDMVRGDGIFNSKGNTLGPCPVCKGRGSIPDDRYRATAMEIYSRADYQTILAALNSLKQRADSGASSAVLAEEIDKRHPILKALKPFLPKTGKTWLPTLA